MEPLSGKEITAHMSGILSPKHQVHGYAVDLTVKSISEVDPVGRVDFGGSEYTAAGKMPVGTVRRTPEDKYTWWDLGRGAYFVELNESLILGENEIAVIEPDERLLRAGATHTPLYLRGRMTPLEALLEVNVVRLQVKQNARISRVRVFRFADGASSASKPAAAKKASGKKK